jgi:hypothetical protein
MGASSATMGGDLLPEGYEDRVYNVKPGAVVGVWVGVVVSAVFVVLLVISFARAAAQPPAPACQCPWPSKHTNSEWPDSKSSALDIELDTPDLCALSCCYMNTQEQHCMAWSFDGTATPKLCYIWESVPPKPQTPAPGWTSAANSPVKHCPVPAGVTWAHPKPIIKPTHAFISMGFFALAAVLYFGGGMTLLCVLRVCLKREITDVLPNQDFWVHLAGLIMDGVHFTFVRQLPSACPQQTPHSTCLSHVCDDTRCKLFSLYGANAADP